MIDVQQKDRLMLERQIDGGKIYRWWKDRQIVERYIDGGKIDRWWKDIQMVERQIDVGKIDRQWNENKNFINLSSLNIFCQY